MSDLGIFTWKLTGRGKRMGRPTSLHHYSGLYSPEDLDRITELGDSLDLIEGAVLVKGKDAVEHKKRNTKIAWVHHTNETAWIFIKMAKLWELQPISMLQSFQYSVYDVGGHYDWHRDIGANDESVSDRVIAGILQLSEPTDYKGGLLEVENIFGNHTIEKERGMITTFPAGWRHRVTPVTHGVRKTLVMWGLR